MGSPGFNPFVPPSSSPLVPTGPVPAALQIHLNQVLADLDKLPPTQSKTLGFNVSTQGADIGFGSRLGKNGSIEAYAGKEWASGWVGGATGKFAW